MISIRTERNDQRLFSQGRTVFQKAESGALAKTIAQARTLTSKEVRAKYRLDMKDMKRNLSLTLPKNATYTGEGSLVAELKIRGRRFQLYRFMTKKPSRKRHTVFEAEFEKGASITRANAFLAIPKSGKNSGKESAYERVGSDRFPIKRLFSDSLPIIFDKLSLRSKLDALVKVKLQAEFERLANLYFHQLM